MSKRKITCHWYHKKNMIVALCTMLLCVIRAFYLQSDLPQLTQVLNSGWRELIKCTKSLYSWAGAMYSVYLGARQFPSGNHAHSILILVPAQVRPGDVAQTCQGKSHWNSDPVWTQSECLSPQNIGDCINHRSSQPGVSRGGSVSKSDAIPNYSFNISDTGETRWQSR